MPHDTPLISMLVIGLGLAFVFGAVTHRLKISPLVGYLLAGVVVGPFTPGFIANQTIASELAEIGVILLMFGVGLHFSPKDLLSVRAIAIPGAVVQIIIATLMGGALAWALGWPLPAGLVFGLALSVASTVVLLRALQERRLVETERGKIAVGWLVVEDLAMVLVLVLLPALARMVNGGADTGETVDPLAARLGLGLPGVLALTLAKVATFIAFMLIVGRRVIPWVLHLIAHSGSRELFRLGVLAIALGVAYVASKLFGVSFALGAFFAGMVLAESELSHQAARESLPLRDAFAVLFFVSVGMLFDPMILVHNPGPVLATILIILFGKSIAAYIIVRLFGHPIITSLTIAASLAQIGEFSFILADLGVRLHLLPEEGRDLILAGAILSILVNPMVFLLIDRLKPRLEAVASRLHHHAHPEPAGVPAAAAAVAAPAPHTPDPEATAVRHIAEEAPAALPPPPHRKNHTILVGHGTVGAEVARALTERNISFVVIEDQDAVANALKKTAIDFITGNAADPTVLATADLATARRLVVAIPDVFETGQVVEQARKVNPDIEILARSDFDAGAEHLSDLGADVIIRGQAEVARGLVDLITGVRPVHRRGTPPAQKSDLDLS
ncbi:cation:proton antiporter [Segnochrobactraceae bacterium EtOH-i3]